MSRGLTVSDVHHIADSLREQGMKVRRTKVGYFLLCPRTGNGTSIHFTESDWRSIKNFRARIERWGYQLPPGIAGGSRKHG